MAEKKKAGIMKEATDAELRVLLKHGISMEYLMPPYDENEGKGGQTLDTKERENGEVQRKSLWT